MVGLKKMNIQDPDQTAHGTTALLTVIQYSLLLLILISFVLIANFQIAFTLSLP